MAANAPSIYSDILGTLISSPILTAAVVAGVTLTAVGIGSYVWREVKDACDAEIYGSDDIKALESLKSLYKTYVKKDSLQGRTPATWELDEKNKPRYVIAGTDLIRALNESVTERNNCGFLHSYVVDFCTLSGGIIKERQGYYWYAWSNKGRPGDPSELFFAENIEWALNIMPAMGPNQQTITAIKDRIKYLQKVKADPRILIWKTGKKPDVNQLVAVDKLIACLNSAKAHVEYTIKQQVTRDKLSDLKQNSEEILKSVFHYLYRLRDELISFPLGLFEWFTQSAKLTVINNKLFEKLFATHTGLMLREALRVSGSRPFGIESLHTAPLVVKEGYLDNSGAEQGLINNRDVPSGVPKWLLSDSYETEQSYLHLLRSVLIQMVVFSRAQKLLVDAYEIAGQRGDAWILGTDAGKLAVRTILDMVSDQRASLDNAILALNEFSEESRAQYFLDHKIAGDALESKIWEDAKLFYESYERTTETMAERLEELQSHVSNIPKGFEKSMSLKRADFLLGVCDFIRTHRQDKSDEASELQKYLEKDFDSTKIGNAQGAAILPPQAVNLASGFDEPVAIGQFPLQQLMLNTRTDPITGLLELPSESFQAHFAALPASSKVPESIQWHLGDDYNSWASGFIHRHALHFTEYERNARILNTRLANKGKIRSQSELDTYRESCNMINANMRRALVSIKQMLENTRPVWRGGLYWFLGCIPIPYPKTVGWPFNGLANKFAQMIDTEILSRRRILDFNVPSLLNGIQPNPIAEIPPSGLEHQDEEEQKEAQDDLGYELVDVDNVDVLQLSDDDDEIEQPHTHILGQPPQEQMEYDDEDQLRSKDTVTAVRRAFELSEHHQEDVVVSEVDEAQTEELSDSINQQAMLTHLVIGKGGSIGGSPASSTSPDNSAGSEVLEDVADEDQSEFEEDNDDESPDQFIAAAALQPGVLGKAVKSGLTEREKEQKYADVDSPIAQQICGTAHEQAAFRPSTSSITSVARMLSNIKATVGSKKAAHAPQASVESPDELLKRRTARLERIAQLDKAKGTLKAANTLKKEVFGAIVRAEESGEKCLKPLTKEILEMLCEVRVQKTCVFVVTSLTAKNYSQSQKDYLNILLMVVNQSKSKDDKSAEIDYYLAQYPPASQPKDLIENAFALRTLTNCGQEVSRMHY